MTPVSIWTEETLSSELRNRRGDEWTALSWQCGVSENFNVRSNRSATYQAVEFLQCVWKAVGI